MATKTTEPKAAAPSIAAGDLTTRDRELLLRIYRAMVLTRSEAIGRGWFGSVDSAVLPRIGDVVVACHGDFAVMATDAFPYERRLVGMHGSLTPAEMLIPVLVD